MKLQSDFPDNSSVQKQCEHHLCSAENSIPSVASTQMAKKNVHLYTITFNFQQNLSLPHLPVGDLHQLWLYVFGVHRRGNNEVTMFCWPEATAKRGSDEVISCLHATLSQLPTSLRLY